MQTIAKRGRAQGVKTLFVLARSLTTRITQEKLNKEDRRKYFGSKKNSSSQPFQASCRVKKSAVSRQTERSVAMAERGTRADIDLGELERLCAIQCTDEEIAAWFNVSTRTI